YELSNFNLENLQKLAILTTQVCNVQKSRGLPYVQKSRGPYMQKINLDNNKRIRRKPPKLCSDCKETNDCILKLVSGRLDRIEEIINNFDKNLSNQSTAEFSKFNAKFTMNNVPCELEYNLSDFNL